MAGDVPRGTGEAARLLILEDQGGPVRVGWVDSAASEALGAAEAAHSGVAAHRVDGNESSRTQIFTKKKKI